MHPFYIYTAHIPLFLYPFLHTIHKTRPFEYLRLTSLGVIGALVKVTLIICQSTLIWLNELVLQLCRNVNTLCLKCQQSYGIDFYPFLLTVVKCLSHWLVKCYLWLEFQYCLLFYDFLQWNCVGKFISVGWFLFNYSVRYLF